MNLLILKGFNNYFNRKIKKYSDLADYIANSSEHYLFGDVNFNPNDGVATSQVIGSENQQQTGGPEPVPLNWEVDGSPDYLIAYTSETIDEQVVNTIHSRWFVLESVRTRAGQYQLALKRDIIADKLEEILTNPCFVEKGYVETNNPLIFNEEGVSVNQIKKSETMLKDETGIPWIVMYIAKNYKRTWVEAQGDTPAHWQEEAVPIEGKMTLDTSQALDVSDLPWANIFPATVSTAKTYRIKGASEIVISPITAEARTNSYTSGQVNDNPYRSVLVYYYSNNDWFMDKTNTRVERIGNNKKNIDGTLYALVRKDIGLTPETTAIKNDRNNGGIVCAYHSINDVTTGINITTIKSQKMAEMLLQTADLTTNKNSASNVVNIKSYLNSKRSLYNSNTGHSAVPGNPNMEAYVGGNQTFLPQAELMHYNGKIVKSGVDYYRIKIARANNYNTKIDYFILDGSGNIQNTATNNLGQYLIRPSDFIYRFERNINNTMVETYIASGWFDIQYERVQGDLLRFTLPKPLDRTQLNDAAFDMICFPYGAIDYIIPNDGNTQDLSFISSKEASLGMARSIAAQLGDALYDMQLLPYCPYREVAASYKEDGYINFGLTTAFPYSCWSGVYKIDNSGDTPSRTNAKSFGIWCPQSSGSFDIEYEIETSEDDAIEYKLFNASKKFRLVSPNYSGIFEFNPLKNNGVTIFNIDFTYKPYNPYIHIAPFFNENGLYGVDTNDQRGLILQGDFSIGYYSDKWAEYQIQNANYANIFNRQLENIDFNQRQEQEKFRVDRTTEGITEVLGLGGGMQGAKSFSGLGPWGMLGGAIGGTVGGITAHGVGTYYDKKWMQESQKEERSYAVDMYNLNLGNVKAMPYGLAKSDALTANFKYFPFIEEYDCTSKEKEIFQNKIKYDGMTVNAIGTLADYLPQNNEYDFQLLRGRMIMLDNITDDFQIANDIYTEVVKGFYYVPTQESGD